MTFVSSPISRVEPEMPGMNADYMITAFGNAEAGLRNVVQTMSIVGESDRAMFIPKAEERLKACEFLGSVAGIEHPTPIMEDAQAAIQTTIDN